jgi:hypothetical protein
MKKKKELLDLKEEIKLEIAHLDFLIEERRGQLLTYRNADKDVVLNYQNYFKFLAKEKSVRQAQVQIIDWIIS